MTSTIEDEKNLKPLAGEILGAFAAIADAAGADLARRGVSLDDLAFVSQVIGATRAATPLGVTSRQQALPPELARLAAFFGDAW